MQTTHRHHTELRELESGGTEAAHGGEVQRRELARPSPFHRHTQS